MNNNITKIEFNAEGVVCNGCEDIIKKQAMTIKGVKQASFDYASGKGELVFDKRRTDAAAIFKRIEEKGYRCSSGKPAKKNILGLILGIAGILLIIFFLLRFESSIAVPQLSQNIGYWLLFLVGLLTGFHCIAMCGGFVVSYTASDAQKARSPYKSHLLYASGKILSYTIIGAAFGLLGSIIAFTPPVRGIAGVIAGIFLVLFGLKMLNVFPLLRYVQIKTPGFITRLMGKNQNANPLVIGLLNGLMIACGPLQAIYIMAAGTGSLVEGAKLLFIFALGTLPVMIGFGFFTTFISRQLTSKILKISGLVVIVLGIMMLNNGLVLSGSGFDFNSIKGNLVGQKGEIAANPASGISAQKDDFQEIYMTVDGSGFTPNSFVLKKGIPVKWHINGKELNSCNNAIQVPAYKLQFSVLPGEQVIEFTPTEAGTIRWSCWMGMIQGTFIVTEDGIASKEQIQTAAPVASGGCGCGMKKQFS